MIQIEMQMPKSCAACDFLKVYAKKDHFKCIPGGRYLYDEDKIWMTEKRPNWCPLKEQEDQEYVEPIPTPTDSSGWFFKCNKCSNPINWKDKFCSMCGKAVKWE